MGVVVIIILNILILLLVFFLFFLLLLPSVLSKLFSFCPFFLMQIAIVPYRICNITHYLTLFGLLLCNDVSIQIKLLLFLRIISLFVCRPPKIKTHSFITIACLKK